MDTSETLINNSKFKKYTIKPILKYHSFHPSHWQRKTMAHREESQQKVKMEVWGSWLRVLGSDFLENSFPALLWVPCPVRWTRGNPWALRRIDGGADRTPKGLIRKANWWTSQGDPGAPLSWNERQRACRLIGMHRAHSFPRIATGHIRPQKHLQAGSFERQPPNTAALAGQRWNSLRSHLLATLSCQVCAFGLSQYSGNLETWHTTVLIFTGRKTHSGMWCNLLCGTSPMGKELLPMSGLPLSKFWCFLNFSILFF